MTSGYQRLTSYLGVDSFTQAAQWASKGHKSGIATEARQISFRCKEDPAVKLACTAASGRGPAAYTTHPGASEGGGWQITFCPTFFITKTLNDLTNGYHYRDINNLMSQEHVLGLSHNCLCSRLQLT